jgi:hypothetical protein
MIVIGGWTLRNIKTANYAGFSSVGTINIYRYYACLLMAHQKNISFDEQQKICDAHLALCDNQKEQSEYALKHGLPVIKSAPFTYLLLHLKTDINTFLPGIGDLYALLGVKIGGGGTLAVIHSKGIIAGVKHYFQGHWALFFLALPLAAILLIKYILSAFGILITIYKRKPYLTTYLFFLLIILYMTTVPGAVSHPRFRVPIEPLLAILAASALTWKSIEKQKNTIDTTAQKA